MTDPTHEIAPRIVDGEPECSRQCPVYRETADGEMFDACHADMAFGENTLDGEPCIPGLRRQRDERTAERDAARREVCENYHMLSGGWLCKHTVEVRNRIAASRNWSYLYETPEGGEG